MHMKEKVKLLPLTGSNLRRMTSLPGELRQLSLTKTRNVLRRLKSAPRTKTLIAIADSSLENFSRNHQPVSNQESDGKGMNSHRHEASKADDSSTKLSLSFSSPNGVVLSSFGSETREKNDSSESFTCETFGLVSVIGRRKEMEDAVKVELGFVDRGGQKFDFFAVYDGHGGSHVAQACRDRLHRVVVEEVESEGVDGGVEWEKVMVRCFEKMDEEVINGGSVRLMGSTAVVAVVGEKEVVVANCGDSRAVISRGGVAVALSSDHKPDRPDELNRIEAAGGKVINWNGHRVLGVLATSRSIGDQYLKPYVISTPEVTVRERTDNNEFLILASDGLWDVISNEVACQVVRKCLEGRKKRKSLGVVNESRAAEAAAVLAELAMTLGSTDNISVIVVEPRKQANFFS